MMKRSIALFLLVAGCSAPQAISLQNSETKQVVSCQADPWAVWSWDIPRWNEECAQRYERNGYTRMK